MSLKTLKDTTISLVTFPPKIVKSIYNYYSERKTLWREFFMWKKYGSQVYNEIKIQAEYDAKYQALVYQSNIEYDQANTQIKYHYMISRIFLHIVNELTIQKNSLAQQKFQLPEQITQKKLLMKKYADLLYEIEKNQYPLVHELLNQAKKEETNQQKTIRKLTEQRSQEKQAYENAINGNQTTNTNLIQIKDDKITQGNICIKALRAQISEQDKNMQKVKEQLNHSITKGTETQDKLNEVQVNLYTLTQRFETLTNNNQDLTNQLLRYKNIEVEHEALQQTVQHLKQECTTVNHMLNLKTLEALHLQKELDPYKKGETTAIVFLKSELIQKEAEMKKLALTMDEYNKINTTRELTLKETRNKMRTTAEEIATLKSKYDLLEKSHEALEEEKTLLFVEKMKLQKLNATLTKGGSDCLLAANKAFEETLAHMESFPASVGLPISLITTNLKEILQSSQTLEKLKTEHVDAKHQILGFSRELETIQLYYTWGGPDIELPPTIGERRNYLNIEKNKMENIRNAFAEKITRENKILVGLNESNNTLINKLETNFLAMEANLSITKAAYNTYQEYLYKTVLPSPAFQIRSTESISKYNAPKSVYAKPRKIIKQIYENDLAIQESTNDTSNVSNSKSDSNNVVD